MTKVYCADISCKYVNDEGVCTQKSIGLAWSSVMTVHDGRQEYNKCRMYHESEKSEMIRKIFEEHNDSKGV